MAQLPNSSNDASGTLAEERFFSGHNLPSHEQANGSNSQASQKIEKSSRQPTKPAKPDKAEQVNRAVFISKLPPDTTLTEIDEEFSKFGMIDMGADGTKRIKMYNDDNGVFKGEALVTYFKPESVPMAINMLDDYPFLYRGGNISVKEADMSYKRETGGRDEVRNKMTRAERKRKEDMREEMKSRLTAWSSDEEERVHKKAKVQARNKWAKVVIIKKAFSLEELDEDVAAISDIKEDFQEAAEEHGDVTKVVVFDKEPEGIVTVRFKEDSAAESFAKAANGKEFGVRNGVQIYLEASVAKDRTKFKKSGKGTASDDDEDAARLDAFVDGGKYD